MIRLLLCLVLAVAPLSAQTLDAALARIMGGREGTAVVVEVESGHVLGSYRMDIASRRLARPGSAIKPFTLLALLRSNKVQANTPFLCRRTLHVGRQNLTCSHPQNGQPLDAVTALAYSCNDYFATMGARLSAAELSNAFRDAGFGSPSGFTTKEAVGFLRPAQTSEERQLQAIGEGNERITPLEMLVAYRKLALLRKAASPTQAEKTVFAGLEASAEYGMARLASVKTMKVAGKTGTARTDGGSWTNGWFAGYAPADSPKIAVVVFLERGTGPGDAAPLAPEIFKAWAQK